MTNLPIFRCQAPKNWKIKHNISFPFSLGSSCFVWYYFYFLSVLGFVGVSPEKVKSLHEEMESLKLFEKDIKESFISGSGSGGQKINKTQNCVYLKHLPTGIEVKCQKDRSREANRFFARRELLDRFKEKILAIPTKKSLGAKKIRKQKKRRQRRSDTVDDSPGASL